LNILKHSGTLRLKEKPLQSWRKKFSLFRIRSARMHPVPYMEVQVDMDIVTKEN
jgi:hypothetical protein